MSLNRARAFTGFPAYILVIFLLLAGLILLGADNVVQHDYNLPAFQSAMEQTEYFLASLPYVAAAQIVQEEDKVVATLFVTHLAERPDIHFLKARAARIIQVSLPQVNKINIHVHRGFRHDTSFYNY